MIVDNRFSLDTHKKKLLQRQLCTLPFKKKKKEDKIKYDYRWQSNYL